MVVAFLFRHRVKIFREFREIILNTFAENQINTQRSKFFHFSPVYIKQKTFPNGKRKK